MKFRMKIEIDPAQAVDVFRVARKVAGMARSFEHGGDPAYPVERKYQAAKGRHLYRLNRRAHIGATNKQEGFHFTVSETQVTVYFGEGYTDSVATFWATGQWTIEEAISRARLFCQVMNNAYGDPGGLSDALERAERRRDVMANDLDRWMTKANNALAKVAELEGE